MSEERPEQPAGQPGPGEASWPPPQPQWQAPGQAGGPPYPGQPYPGQPYPTPGPAWPGYAGEVGGKLQDEREGCTVRVPLDRFAKYFGALVAGTPPF